MVAGETYVLATTLMTTVPSIEDHPLVAANARQRRELAETLAASDAERVRLLAERERLAGEAFDQEVSRLLGESGTSDDAIAGPLAKVEQDLAQVTARVGVLQAGLTRLDATAQTCRAQAEAEQVEQVRADARKVVRAMVPLVEKLERLNAELVRLHERGGHAAGLPIPYVTAIASPDIWLSTARAFAGSRE